MIMLCLLLGDHDDLFNEYFLKCIGDAWRVRDTHTSKGLFHSIYLAILTIYMCFMYTLSYNVIPEKVLLN